MLEIDTLSVNKRIFNPNVSDQSKAIGIWDLTQASVNYDIEFMNSRKVFRVTSDTVMRPDLISLYQIGESQYCGSLMKVNGISNPFSIDEGRLLFILSPQMIRKTYDRKKIKLLVNQNPNKIPHWIILKKLKKIKCLKLAPVGKIS